MEVCLMASADLVEQSDVTAANIQFEDDYIFRNCRSITSTPDLALTEFVANSWDAGACNVKIILPTEIGEEISIEDDGTGMSDEEFLQRWMTLNYNRQRRQGKNVSFPPDVEPYSRIAYGRNGIGRHSMLCFADYYTVMTWQNNICHKYTIALTSGSQPFAITHHNQFPQSGHGTKITAFVQRHLPDIESMTEIISARFLYDPRFIVSINGKIVDLSNHQGIYDKKEVTLESGTHIILTIVDSTKTAMKSQQHGIAFWVSGRLVGKPAWSHGGFQFLDGRTQVAKRYTIIVQTNDLIDEVMPDWTGFIETPNTKSFYLEIKSLVDSFISSVMSEQIKEVQLSVISESRDSLMSLNRYSQREVSYFIEAITEKNPIISLEFLKSAVDAVISLEQSKRGEQLLKQLSNMSPNEIDKLSELLTNWNIDDILSVINEIDRRIVVIEAIEKLHNDKSIDELHTLHPIVLNARWLFGPEFDSPMFTSNVALSTVVKSLFKDSEYDLSVLANPRKRPDIVCLKKYSFKAVCTDRVDSEAGNILKPDQILIIELKRGGFEITQEEVSQATHYVRQIKKSGVLHKSANIHAFVVGASIGDIDPSSSTDSGIVDVVTYGQLIQTANIKLFELRKQLQDHYDSLGNESIVEEALRQTRIKGT